MRCLVPRHRQVAIHPAAVHPVAVRAVAIRQVAAVRRHRVVKRFNERNERVR